MDKNRFYSFVLFAGILIGALMAAYSVIEKSNISDYKWAAKIEDTSIPMEVSFTIRRTGSRQKIALKPRRQKICT